MDTIEKKFKTGDWVQIVNDGVLCSTGFITKCHYLDKEFRVRFTITADGKKSKWEAWCRESQLEKLEATLSEENILALIDHALERKEKQWFLELHAKLPSKSMVRPCS